MQRGLLLPVESHRIVAIPQSFPANVALDETKPAVSFQVLLDFASLQLLAAPVGTVNEMKRTDAEVVREKVAIFADPGAVFDVICR